MGPGICLPIEMEGYTKKENDSLKKYLFQKTQHPNL